MPHNGDNNNSVEKQGTNAVIVQIIGFLSIFIPETLAKRIISIILITADMEISQIARLTGCCDKTVKAVKKRLSEQDIRNLLKLNGGGGRKSKYAEVEESIVNEINQNQYHSRQQIADMIYEKYGLNVSVSAVGKLLKKMALNA